MRAACLRRLLASAERGSAPSITSGPGRFGAKFGMAHYGKQSRHGVRAKNPSQTMLDGNNGDFISTLHCVAKPYTRFVS